MLSFGSHVQYITVKARFKMFIFKILEKKKNIRCVLRGGMSDRSRLYCT